MFELPDPARTAGACDLYGNGPIHLHGAICFVQGQGKFLAAACVLLNDFRKFNTEMLSDSQRDAVDAWLSRQSETMLDTVDGMSTSLNELHANIASLFTESLVRLKWDELFVDVSPQGEIFGFRRHSGGQVHSHTP